MRARVAPLLVLLFASGAPARAASMDLVRPVRGDIVRHFEAPPSPYGAGHRGIDMAVPSGTSVLAAAAGTVAFAGQVGGQLFVSVDHEGGLRSTYSYLGSVMVRAGAEIGQGEQIATSGACHGSGPDGCLHFGIRRGKEYLDPEPMLVASMRANLWRVVRLAG